MDSSLFDAAIKGFLNILQLKVFFAMAMGVGIGTFVVLASTADLDMADFEAHLAKVGARTAFPVSPDAMDALARNERAVVLTDDYAPVDNLIAPVFGERFGRD